MKLTIKNMVCDRCKTAVERIMHDQGLVPRHVDLGEVILEPEPAPGTLDMVRGELEKQGFELVDEREVATITRLKAAIVKLVHHGDAIGGRVKLSEHLADALNRNYSTLSTLFSQVEGISIEHYFLLQRLERVKELIRYGDQSLSEIADRTGFSSVAHLSTQFKKLTGMTPSAFKGLEGGRTSLDRIG